MNTSRQEVIDTLKSCLPIYHKLFDQVGYQLTEDDRGCLETFLEFWKASSFDDESVLEEAGMSFIEMGYLVGYAADYDAV